MSLESFWGVREGGRGGMPAAWEVKWGGVVVLSTLLGVNAGRGDFPSAHPISAEQRPRHGCCARFHQRRRNPSG